MLYLVHIVTDGQIKLTVLKKRSKAKNVTDGMNVVLQHIYADVAD